MTMRLLPFQVSICGVPELPRFAGRGVSHVIGILDPGTARPGAYADLSARHHAEFRFHDIVQPEALRLAPSRADVEALLQTCESVLDAAPDHVLVHCWAGISRSTATASMLLALRNPGREDEVFAALSVIRPQAWPNTLMISHADDILGRRGALVSALKAHHIRQAERSAELRDLMHEVGRAHELPEQWRRK
ncbi:tyrosine phosphatase family protein [Ferrovibrio sp.]|uniref:tyrosine phosphatase family protein n=1 Tax=Ferrovibrio sp. TaxID=1917215 RepID=UPI0035B1F319